MAKFSTLEEAVEAVDYELGARGPAVAHSALPSAAWRRVGGDGDRAKALQQALWERIVHRSRPEGAR
jgi:hypothetical protein